MNKAFEDIKVRLACNFYGLYGAEDIKYLVELVGKQQKVVDAAQRVLSNIPGPQDGLLDLHEALKALCPTGAQLD